MCIETTTGEGRWDVRAFVNLHGGVRECGMLHGHQWWMLATITFSSWLPEISNMMTYGSLGKWLPIARTKSVPLDGCVATYGWMTSCLPSTSTYVTLPCDFACSSFNSLLIFNPIVGVEFILWLLMPRLCLNELVGVGDGCRGQR